MSDIDVVITWLDNQDPEWQRSFKKAKAKKDIFFTKDNCRFEDLGTLKYIFRGIEKYMPWVRNVHLVTCGQHPKCLKKKHPKLRIVNHKNIFLYKEALPTFNSSAIEMNFHRIPDLSEKFIYFNDDMFVLKKLHPDYFFKNNLPVMSYNIRNLFHNDLCSHMFHSNMLVINKEIQRKGTFVKQFFKVINLNHGIKHAIKSFLLMISNSREIPLIVDDHLPSPHLKSNFIEVEAGYQDEVIRTSFSTFREAHDLNQYIFKYWGFIHNRYVSKKTKDGFFVLVEDMQMFQTKLDILLSKKPSLVCFSEHKNFIYEDYPKYKKALNNFLNLYMPEKCSWEK